MKKSATSATLLIFVADNIQIHSRLQCVVDLWLIENGSTTSATSTTKRVAQDLQAIGIRFKFVARWQYSE